MDSPGHSAQYCTYTTIEQDTMNIISIVTVDKRQTDRKSVAMEKARLKGELSIKEIVTDAHVQIVALMHPEKGRYKNKGSPLPGHLTCSKEFDKKTSCCKKDNHFVFKTLQGLCCYFLVDLFVIYQHAGMISGHKQILVWIKDIVNHFWFSCQKADNREGFMDMWRGVLHHVSGEHEWALGRCQPAPQDVGSSQKELIPSGSAAHEALSQIVLNRRWLKDVEKFKIYEARTLLAALDYNHHNHRPVHVNNRGQVSQRRIYSKKSKRYHVQMVKVAKDYSYIPQLQSTIWGNVSIVKGDSQEKGLLGQMTLGPLDITLDLCPNLHLNWPRHNSAEDRI